MWQLCDSDSGHPLNRNDQVVTSDGKVGRLKAASPDKDCVVLVYSDETSEICSAGNIGAEFAEDDCENVA